LVNTSLSLITRGVYAAAHPLGTLKLARDAVEGVGEIVWAGLNPAPETPLNVPIGPHRRYAVVRQQLDDYKRVKNAFGGTVNDVVLTVVSGALAGWLRSRGVRTEGLEMRALVPVSVRTREQRGSLGNQLTVMRGPLPIYIDDPVARLRFVRQAMDGLKESKQAVGAATLVAVNNLAPPTILAQASRLNFSTRLFNLLVTNIPGPQMPLYVLGRQLEDLFPVAFLPNNHALAVAIMSYKGGIDYGLLGDYDALPDIDVVAEGIESSLEELLDAGRQHEARQRDEAPATDTSPAELARVQQRSQQSGEAEAAGLDEAPAEDDSQGAPAGESTLGPNGGPSPIIPLSGGRSKRGPAADMRSKRGERSRSGPKGGDG
jgi:WS/DGAT/MGAT family acyltransferase